MLSGIKSLAARVSKLGAQLQPDIEDVVTTVTVDSHGRRIGPEPEHDGEVIFIRPHKTHPWH